MTNVIVAFYNVDGVADSVETPLIGNPRAEYAELARLIKVKHPGAKEFIRAGSRIETRSEEDPGFIELLPGQTIRQIFDAPNGKADPLRKVGSVFFNGQPCEIILTHSRAAGTVGLMLKPRLSTGASVRFSNQLSPQRLASELPAILAEIFGSDARNLKLLLREKAK